MVLSNLSPFVGKAAAEEAEEQSDLSLLDRASTWKYLDNGTDQGTAWKEKDFNDSEWKSGAAPLGYPASEKHGHLVILQQSLIMVAIHKTSMQHHISERHLK